MRSMMTEAEHASGDGTQEPATYCGFLPVLCAAMDAVYGRAAGGGSCIPRCPAPCRQAAVRQAAVRQAAALWLRDGCRYDSGGTGAG